jgi:hypothetical protein
MRAQGWVVVNGILGILVPMRDGWVKRAEHSWPTCHRHRVTPHYRTAQRSARNFRRAKRVRNKQSPPSKETVPPLCQHYCIDRRWHCCMWDFGHSIDLYFMWATRTYWPSFCSYCAAATASLFCIL